MNFRFIIIMYIVSHLIACVEVYNPPVIQNNNQYLVIEGYLDLGQRSCIIKANRTLGLSDELRPIPATDLSIQLEELDGQRIILVETDPGNYQIQDIDVNLNAKYRLLIKDHDFDYASSFVEPLLTPPIDSIYWELSGDNINIYVDSDNDNSSSRFYQWKYAETWQYNSAYRSFFKFSNGAITRRNSPDEIYYCWMQNNGNLINVATTISLEKNIVKKHLLRTIPYNSRQFQTKYSILVSQYSITKEAYDFWSQVRDNSQGKGSLFDVQPSRIKGNLYCTNGNEPIIGFFSAYSSKSKRIMIDKRETPHSNFESDYSYCWTDTLFVSDIPKFDGNSLIVDELIEIIDLGPKNPPLEIFLGYTLATPRCVDCRILGGTTVRPPFWN